MQPNDHCFQLYRLTLYVGFDLLFRFLIQKPHLESGMKEWTVKVAEWYFHRDFVNCGFRYFEVKKTNWWMMN